jgi:hypothetical protein
MSEDWFSRRRDVFVVGRRIFQKFKVLSLGTVGPMFRWNLFFFLPTGPHASRGQPSRLQREFKPGVRIVGLALRAPSG